MSGHNLNVESYSFHELCGLFHLEPNNVTLDDLKRAKKQVLMTHPDKSKLDPSYFLFYKRAFDIIMRMYENVHKMSKAVENQEYVATDESADKVFRKNLGKMDSQVFQKQFNEIFEKHNTKKHDPSKYEWFTSDTPLYDDSATNASQMNVVMDRIKEKQQQLVNYKGVTSLSGYKNNNYYDEEDDGEYVQCDPFSKLKFDDVRKVHKDETVFSVRESDMANIQTYRNVDDYQRARDVGAIKPMERSHAQKMMETQEQLYQEKIRQKQYGSELSTMRHMENNKQVMANFLKLM